MKKPMEAPTNATKNPINNDSRDIITQGEFMKQLTKPHQTSKYLYPIPYRILCNRVMQVDVKVNLNLTSGLFYHVPLHKYGMVL